MATLSDGVLVKTSTDGGDQAYVEFVRRMLDDMAAGRSYPAAHYEKLFPGCADKIRADFEGEAEAGPQAPESDVPTEITVDRSAVKNAEARRAAASLPERIGPYVISGELATGGMGRLLLARHPEKDEKLVIKTAKAGLEGDDGHFLDRLKREATILGRLDHERICPVTDVLIEGERVYVVMPFIEGETLEARLARACAALRGGARPSAAWSAIGSATASAPSASPPPLPATPQSGRIARDARVGLRTILALMEEVAHAVHAAHEQGIIHRDLKPGNIMVRPDGHPVVLDFGLAVDLSDSQARRFTVKGDLIGTPSYMAPEQVEGEIEAIDRRTDVYALGAILYEVLTFKRAFKASGMNAVYHRVLSGRIEPPRKVNPTIPRDLEAVCLKAMETDPRRRYATGRDFADDLRRVRTLEATLARPVSRLEEFLRRIFRG